MQNENRQNMDFFTVSRQLTSIFMHGVTVLENNLVNVRVLVKWNNELRIPVWRIFEIEGLARL